MSHSTREPEATPKRAYEAPQLTRYGAIDELTQGATQITVDVPDILSIQSGP
jgi:hypothetical protein